MEEKPKRLMDYLYEFERLERDLYRYQIETEDLICEKDRTFLQKRNDCFKEIIANFADVDKLRSENEKLKSALKDASLFIEGEYYNVALRIIEKALNEVTK